MHEKKEKNILRKTKSACPVCLSRIEALVVDRNGKIYFEKNCPQHGDFSIVISEFPLDYKELSKSFLYFIPAPLPQQEYYICVTTRCNLGCPICFLKNSDEKAVNLTPSAIQKISTLKNIKRFTFSHGEATLCEDLAAVIRTLRRAKKFVNIHTNGIKLADRRYALSLKEAGISQISMQFDGFDQKAYPPLRGSMILEDKLKALNNLEEMSIPVSLNVTIAGGVNEQEIGRIFTYALDKNFIKDVSFITYCHYEPDKKVPDAYLMPDQLLLYIQEHTKGRITRHDIVLFQKLFYTYQRIFKKRKCFNYFHYLIARTPAGYFPVSEFIDLKKAATRLDNLRDKNKKLTHFNFLMILLSSLKLKSLPFLFREGSVLLRGGYPRRPTKLLAITFATICDPYKYDSWVAANCGQGIIINEDIHDSYGKYLVEHTLSSRDIYENRLCERFL